MPKTPRTQKSEPCFLEWLLEVLDRQRSAKNAYWLDKKAKIFAVRWVHRKSTLWTEECAGLFKLWKHECRRSWRNHSDDFQKNLKTNFRMNLRSKYFLELTSCYKDENFDYPVRVFKVNKATKKAGKMEEAGTFYDPPVQNNQRTRKESSRQIEYIPSSIFDKAKSSRESHPWANNPTGTTHRMSNTLDSEFWKRTPPYKLSCWDTGFDYSNTTSQEYLNECYQPENELSSLILATDSFNEDLNNREEIDAQCPFMDEMTIADYLLDLETSSYPGCIPEILPSNKGSSMTSRRHSFVTSTTDSGFKERSSTASFSSAWSNEEPSQNLDDFLFIWSLGDFSDSVFE